MRTRAGVAVRRTPNGKRASGETPASSGARLVPAAFACLCYPRFTLKLPPSGPRADGIASFTPDLLLTIVTAVAPAMAGVTVRPSLIVDAFVNCTMPKRSSRTTPLRAVGASSIHSADDVDEPYVTVPL